MSNPFQTNSKTLQSGFYFDKKRGLISFYYTEEEDEMSFFSTNKIYNREIEDNSTPTIFLPPEKAKKLPNVEDLVELELSLLKNKDKVIKDFHWISNRTSIAKAFIDFLLVEEKYELLEVFKVFHSKVRPLIKS